MSLKKNNKFKLIMLVFLPFLIGLSIDILLVVGATKGNPLYLNLGSILLSLWTFGGIVLWFYVGRVGNVKSSMKK